MKIAAFFSDSPWASWSLSQGLPVVLRRMGHEVVGVPVPATQRVSRDQYDDIKTQFPSLEVLNQQDAIIFCGPEHLKEWLIEIYGLETLKAIKAPRLGWYHESFSRGLNYENLRPWLDVHFMPNPQDAEKYAAEFLPVGVDTEMFNVTLQDGPWTCHRERNIPVAFVGLVYDKRQEFLRKLIPALRPEKIKVGNVLVQDIDGIDIRKSAELLADSYRRMKVLLNLPSLSNVLVSKILEGMACGACVVTPRNPIYKLIFKDAWPETYNGEKPEAAADQVKELIRFDSVRSKAAITQCQEVHKHHRMELRLEKMLAVIGGKETNGDRQSVQSDMAEQPA